MITNGRYTRPFSRQADAAQLRKQILIILRKAVRPISLANFGIIAIHLLPISPVYTPARGEGAGNDGRWRAYAYDELINRDKAGLDIFWLRDESLEDFDNLPAPDVLAQEIVEDLEAALEQFRKIVTDLTEGGGE